MKSTLFAFIGIFAITAFAADSYTIANFSGEEAGTPDQYIDAEFGGSLKITASGTVENVQGGRFYVRQKFEDPFGEAPTTYQLYEGREGTDKSSLSQFSLPEGIAYGFIVKAKCYSSADAAPEADVEKIYFDGKSVYAEGVSTLFVHRGVKAVELVAANAPEASSDNAVEESDSYAAAAPVEESSSSSSEDDEYCDDNDPDCESEEDYNYDVQGNVAETANTANSEDYASDEATQDITNRFGVADEVRKWSAWGLVAVAATSIGIGVYDQMQYSDAKSAHDDIDDLIGQHKDAIAAACGGKNACYEATVWYATHNDLDASSKSDLYDLTKRNKDNKSTMDSYSMARNVWFGIAAASIAGSIVLFTW